MRSQGQSARAHAAGPAWLRSALVGAWGLLFALIAGSLAASWDEILGRLARVPAPASPEAPVAVLPPLSAGERALAEARWRREMGDPAGALRALESVTSDDPAWPLARRMRAQIAPAQEGARP
jgi:hypothetical protein